MDERKGGNERKGQEFKRRERRKGLMRERGRGEKRKGKLIIHKQEEELKR